MIGTIFGTAGQPVTLTGYAQDFDAPIVRVHVSGDEGATWSAYDTPGADPNCNVNWSFTFTPPESGAYELLIRAEANDGRLTPQAAHVHVSVGPAV